jgi:hypothetical protein
VEIQPGHVHRNTGFVGEHLGGGNDRYSTTMSRRPLYRQAGVHPSWAAYSGCYRLGRVEKPVHIWAIDEAKASRDITLPLIAPDEGKDTPWRTDRMEHKRRLRC